MAGRRFSLSHSPFLSPTSWEPVSAEFARRGGYYAPVAKAVAEQLADRTLLVAHSGEGALDPSIPAVAESHGWRAPRLKAHHPWPITHAGEVADVLVEVAEMAD